MNSKLLLVFSAVLLIGCTTLSNDKFIPPYQVQRDQASAANSAESGFNVDETKAMLELCIELNNQDDRNNDKLPDPDREFQAKPNGWDLVYDSRAPQNTEWNKIWPNDTPGQLNPLNDIKKNGIKPLNNAWLLAKSQTNSGHYAIAIRGTVSERESILADAYATTIPAYAGIEYPKNKPLPIVFAATPMAEVHLGFAYAAMALLFDDERGILTQLKQLSQDQPITKLYITGHSQGAAVATLIHAFLYYAIKDPNIPYGLDALQNTALKSYLFAQPKPGNLQFAQDFARIASGNAFVINNDRDPVPQVPLSLETVSEVATYVEADNADISVGGTLNRLLSTITDIKGYFRGSFAEISTAKLAKKFKNANIAQSLQKYFGGFTTELADTKAKSLNYTLAGQLIPVFGIVKGDGIYPIKAVDEETKADILLQHHATSYRKLIDRQFKANE